MNLNFLCSYRTSQMLDQAQVWQWFVCFPNAKCLKELQYMHTKRYLTINVCVFDKCKRLLLLPFGDISNQTKKRYTSYSYVLRMRELIDGYLNHIYIFFISVPYHVVIYPTQEQRSYVKHSQYHNVQHLLCFYVSRGILHKQ